MKTGRSILQFCLVGLLLFLSLGAVFGGMSMLLYPDGSHLGLPIDLLEQTPFSNFRIPGSLLLIFLGVLPLFVIYGLIYQPRYGWTKALNLFPAYHWSWTFSYYIGIILILWINMQLILGVGFHLLHFIYDMLGLVIIFTTHLPNLKVHYRL